MAQTGAELLAQYQAEEQAAADFKKFNQQQTVEKEASTVDYNAASEKLVKQIGEKQLGGDLSNYQKAVQLTNKMPTFTINDSAKQQVAKFSFKEATGKDGTQEEINSWMAKNQNTINKNLYASLAQQAKESGIDIGTDPFYQNYVSGEIARTTPKQKEESFGEKAGRIAKGIFLDTPVGLGALTLDTVGLTNNAYKGYFGQQTNLKGSEGFGAKATDLFITQGAIVDAAIAAGSLATGGLGAPALVGMKAAVKGGMKSITKGIFKTVEKTALKEGIEGFEANITKQLGSDFIKVMKGEGDIVAHVASQGDAVAYLGKARNIMISNGVETLTKAGANEKTISKFVSQVDKTFSDIGVRSTKLSSKEKLVEMGQVAVDAFGLPNFIGMKVVKDATGKEIIKLSPSFTKTMFNYAMPASPLIPGAGEWMETTGLRMGSWLAQKYTEQTRGGLIENERQKFKEQYGIDPEQSTGQLRTNWESFVGYKLRNSTFSEALTGTQREGRSLSGQWGWGALDTAVDFVGPLLGIKAAGKVFGAIQEKTTPIGIVDGEIVSNLPYIQRLNEIRLQYSGTERTQAIEQLNEEVKSGKYENLSTTIKSAKGLEQLKNEILQDFRSSNGTLTDIQKHYGDILMEAVEKYNVGDIEGGKQKIMEAEQFHNMTIAHTFNNEKFESVKEKFNLLNSYFDRMRNSSKLVDELTKGFVVNFYTKKIDSETGAAIRGLDSTVGKIKSVFNDIDSRNQQLYDIYDQRAKAMGDIASGKTGDLKIIKENIIDALTKDGVHPEQSKKIADVIGETIHNKITTVFLSMPILKEYNLGNLFKEVFTDFGLNKLKNSVEASTKTAAENPLMLIRQLQGLDKSNKLSDTVERTITEDIQEKRKNIPDLESRLGEVTKQIVLLTQLKSDIANKVHTQHELQRQQSNFTEPVSKEIPVDEKIKELEIQLEHYKTLSENGVESKEKIKQVEEALETVKEAKEEGTATIKEMQVLSEEDKKNILESSTIDNIRGADGHIEKIDNDISSTETQISAIRDTIDRQINEFSSAVANLMDSHIAYKKYIEKPVEPSEDKSDRFDDEVVRNQYRLQSYDDLIRKSIPDYANLVSRAFTRDSIDMNGLKDFDEEFKQMLRETWDKNSKKLLSEFDSLEPNNRKIAALRRMLNNIQESANKAINRDGIIDLAKNSATHEEFIQNFRALIQQKFGFTDSAAEKFLINTFGGKTIEQDGDVKTIVDADSVLPIYSLYKSTYKIDAAKIDLDTGEILFSKDPENIDAFLDKHGNVSSLYRVKGLEMERLEKKYDVVLVDDIIKNKESATPENFFYEKTGSGDKTRKQEFDEMFENVENKMLERGYVFLGSFQEQGKKILFIKPKEGIVSKETALEYQYDAIKFITGVDFKQIDKLDFDTKNQIMSNFAKYAKLLLWGEIKIDKNVFQKEFKRDHTIDIIFDDNAKLSTGEDIKKCDGRVLTFRGYQDVLKKIIGANKFNDTYKTASSVGGGIFVKSQDGLATDSIFQDKNIREAFERFFNESGLFQNIISDPLWFKNDENVQTIYSEISNKKLIDRIIPLSALKNIYTRKINPEQLKGIQFDNYEAGQIMHTDISKIGVKTHDQYKSPEYAANESIAISYQILRNWNNDYKGVNGDKNFNQACDTFFKKFNDIRTTDFGKLQDILEKGGDPIATIHRIQEEFGITFTSFEKQQFIATHDFQNIVNMASNIMRRYVTSDITIKGNKLDLTYIPDYENVRDAINAQPNMKNQQDNFIILDKEYYSHLDKSPRDNEGNLRFMLFRYPIVSRQVITAPVIIWVQDLPNITGNAYIPHLGSATAPSHKIIKRVEGDGDGDSLYLMTDDRFADGSGEMFKYIDEVFTDTADKNVDSQEANIQQNTSMNAMELFKAISFDTFEGKANIGKIDNTLNKFSIAINLKLVDPAKVEKLRALMGQLEQRAVDNKSIDISKAIQKLDDSMGTLLKDIPSIPSTSSKVKFGDIRVFTGMKNGKPSYIYPNMIKVTNTVQGEYFKNLFFQKANNIKPDSDKKYTITLSEKEKQNLDKINVYNIKNAIAGVQQFVSKNDYSSGERKNRTIFSIQKEWATATENINFLKSAFPTETLNDPTIKFVEQIGKNIERGVYNFKEDLQNNINTAFSRVASDMKNIGAETIQGDKAIISDKLQNYRTIAWLRKEEVNSLLLKKEELTDNEKAKISLLKQYGFKEGMSTADFKKQSIKAKADITLAIDKLLLKNPGINFDGMVIEKANGNFNHLHKELLTLNAKDQLDKAMTKEIYISPVKHVKGYLQEKVDLESIMNSYGKDDPKTFMEEVIKSINQYEQYTKEFNDNLTTHLDTNTARTMARLSLSGVDVPDLRKMMKTISTLGEDDRVQALKSLAGFSEKDMKVIADVFENTPKDDNVAKILVNFLGIKDISNNIILKDAEQAKKDIISNPVNIVNNPC